MYSQEVLSLLLSRPSQRKSDEINRLAIFLQGQPFFAGIGLAVLQEICSGLTLHQAGPGDVVLHVGELTDRLYLLLRGNCTVVRHSRREGFHPLPPQKLIQGQALCEASLVVSGRRSDVEVTVSSPSSAARMGDHAAAGGSDRITGAGATAGSSDDGATFAVLTRASWSSLCVRAPVQPLCAQARNALLCCCARSLAAACTPPGVRTLEQADDLAALLRQLPALSGTPEHVLRAMSESAYLRQLPPGTILFEECTRAESEFLVLAGGVQIRRRRRLGVGSSSTGSPVSRRVRHTAAAAAGTAGATSTTAAAAVAVVDCGGKSVREKIEEERKAREALKDSLSLTREGLREPQPAPSSSPPPLKSTSSSRKWMTEYVFRARKVNPGVGTDAEQHFGAPIGATAAGSLQPGSTAAGGGAEAAGSTKGNMSRAANAWRRAVLGVVQSQPTQGSSAAGSDASADGASAEAASADAVDWADGTVDSLLAEYERLKAEEAGQVTDVGNLLGGAGSREAYMRGIRESRARHGYGYEMADQLQEQEEEEETEGICADGVGASANQDDKDTSQADTARDDSPRIDPLVRLKYLDRTLQVATKVFRFGDAAEGLARLLEERAWDCRTLSLAPETGAVSTEPTIQSLTKSEVVIPAAATTAAAKASCLIQVSNIGSGGEALATSTEPSNEQLTELYGPDVAIVDIGQIAGELPEVALCRAMGLSSIAGGSSAVQQAPLLRRADTAIAGPSGADVLVVVLEALRRGHEAARDDLVSERLAVLTALEPLRGLSDEHQAQLALGCTTTALDANQLIIRQGQPVEALYVVLEGEVRLLDDPMEGLAAAAMAVTVGAPSGSSGGGAVASFSTAGRSISLNGGTFGRKAAALTASEAPAAAPPPLPPPSGGSDTGTGGHGSLRVRRALVAMAALTLLGPGGSFGESVLGYPADVAAVTAADALSAEESCDRKTATGVSGPLNGGGSSTTSSDDEGDEGDGKDDHEGGGGGGSARSSGFALGASALGASRRIVSDNAAGNGRTSLTDRTSIGSRPPWGFVPSSQFLASAVTSRPSRLLVLPRSLLVRYGYLRSSLPPFAELRREAINGRRQQLQVGLQNLSEVAMGLLPVSEPPPGAPALPTPSSARGNVGRPPSKPAARLQPPQRPSEFLDQAGFKSRNNPRTSAVLNALNAAAAAASTTGSVSRGASGTAAFAVNASAVATTGDFEIYETAMAAGADHVNGGGGSSGSGVLPFSSLTRAERLKRFHGAASSPSDAHWQFLDSNEALSWTDDGARLPPATAVATSDGTDTATGDFVHDYSSFLSGSGAGFGGDALRAPPKPCAMRTSLTGVRQYVNTVLRPQNEMWNSSSGLPLIPTLNTGGNVTTSAGREFLTRRTVSQGPLMLRTDMLQSNDTTAVAGPAASSPTFDGGRAAAADVLSPAGSGGVPSTPTALPSLGGAASGAVSRPESPRALFATIVFAGSVGGGGGSTPGAATAPLRGILLPLSSSFKKRASYTGNGIITGSSGFGGTSSGGVQIEAQSWERVRESTPGAPQAAHHHHQHHQDQHYQHHQPPYHQPQLNLYPTILSAGNSRSNLSGTPPRSRLRASGTSQTVSQLEILLENHSSLLDQQGPAWVGTNLTLAPAPPPVSSSSRGGLYAPKTANSRHAWRDLPEVWPSWEGESARGSCGSGGGGGGSGNGGVGLGGHVVNRGGTHAATALALAVLAANPAPQPHFLLVP